MATDTITDLARRARMGERQGRLQNRFGMNEQQAARTGRLHQRAVRDWRRGGREGARPTLNQTAQFNMGLRDVDRDDRQDLRRAFRTGGYATPGADLGDMLGSYRAMLAEMPAAPMERMRGDIPAEEMEGDGDMVETPNLNDLIPREQWLNAIRANYSRTLDDGRLIIPNQRYGGFAARETPTLGEWNRLLDQDVRFRPGGLFYREDIREWPPQG